MIELASVNKTFGTLKNLTEDNTYKSLNYWTVKDTNNLYKYNKKAFADIIDPKKFKYLIVHKQLKYIKPKEDTTAHEALLFPNFFAGSYEGVVYIYDLTQNKLVAQSTFSATNSEKVEKDKDSWNEKG